MAVIHGWTDVEAFSTDPDTAKKLAIKKKKALCKDDLKKWTWETCDEYYGAHLTEIYDGSVLVELR
jgi:hypothetical protein